MKSLTTRKMVLSSLIFAGSTWTAAAVGATGSSAPCTNEADFQTGTVVEYESRDNVSPVTSRNKSETLGREDFAGTNPVAVSHTTFMNSAPVFLTTTFSQIKDGKLIRYGDRHGVGDSLTTTRYNPPAATPVDFQPGQTVTINYKNQVVSSAATIDFDVTEKLTYNGRETIKTPLGTFETCRFTNEVSTGPMSGDQPIQKVIVQNWFAAEGPYRGQSIKSASRSGSDGQERVVEVIKMSYETRAN